MRKIFLMLFCLFSTISLLSQVLHLTDMQEDTIVALHNFYRKQIGSDSIFWSDELATKAQQWLNDYSSHPLLTRNPFGYEQNFYVLNDTNICKAIKDWAQEQVFFNGDSSQSAKLYLYQHYYRMINPEFRRIGCAMCKQANDMFVFVCFYSK